MIKTNIDDLVDRAHWGKITPEERLEVIQRIQNYKIGQNDDIYGLLHVLGYARATEYRHLTEEFLIYPQDPYASSIALEVLCMDWGLANEYTDSIKSFLKRVEWDTAEEVRVVAISIAGEYVRRTRDRKCLKCLLDILDGEQERLLIQGMAYNAIARAVGKGWDEIPKSRNFSKDTIDKAVIAQARQILGEEKM